MGQLQLSGQLLAGPPPGTDVALGRAMFQISLALKSGAGYKPFAVASGFITLGLNSPSAYVELQGIGGTTGVTHADTLYLFAYQPILIQLTTDDGSGGDVVSVVPVDGLVVLEFQSTKFLKLLEAKGAAQVEYFASGPS